MDVIELAARQDWCHIDAAISGKISVIHTSEVYCDSVKTRFRRSIPRYILYIYTMVGSMSALVLRNFSVDLI